MKCTKEGCNKPAEYIIDGQSVCEDHRKEKLDITAGDRLVGNI